MGLIQRIFPFFGRAIKIEPDRDHRALTRQLAAPPTAAVQEMSQAQIALSDRLDGLVGEVGKLGREQFRTTTLLEGQGMALEELAEAWREHLRQREREADDQRQAIGELGSQVRLGVVKDLLPVSDALAESQRAARELLAKLQAQRRPRPPLLARLLGARATPGGRQDYSVALEAWLQGILLVERRLLALLEREGVRPIHALGKPFDPHLHLAVAVERDGSVTDGTVVREELRGYTLGDHILRHAEVVVARGDAEDVHMGELGGE